MASDLADDPDFNDKFYIYTKYVDDKVEPYVRQIICLIDSSENPSETLAKVICEMRYLRQIYISKTVAFYSNINTKIISHYKGKGYILQPLHTYKAARSLDILKDIFITPLSYDDLQY